MLIVHVTNTDPAGSAYNFIRAINEHTPHRARLITTQQIAAFEFPKDILDLFDAGDEIEALFRQADVIHFHKVNEDFSFEFELAHRIRRFDLKDYVKGKKIIYHVHGAPGERNFPEDVAKNYAQRNGIVLASTPDLEETYRQFYDKVAYFPNCVPINDVRYLPRATDEPITGDDGETKRYCVFQSGTHSVLKNMHVIRDVMERISKDLPVFFLHTSPEQIQTQDMALRHKRIAHVVFDHIEGYYGLSSLEGFSMGKPVVAGLSDYTIGAICRFFDIMPHQLPWVVARDEQSVEKSIRNLINDASERSTIGLHGRSFMEKIWSDKAIAQRLIAIYEALT